MKIKRYLLIDNMIIIVLSIILYVLLSVFENAIMTYITAISLMLSGTISILHTWKIDKNIINFYNAYYVIWLILIPLTSFSFPLMERMDAFTWKWCLIGNICFSSAIFIVGSIPLGKKKNKFLKCFDNSGKNEIRIYYFVLVISVALLLFNTVKFGPAILTGNVKAKEWFPGYNIITILGSLSVFFLFFSVKKKSKKFWILSGLYGILFAITGVRWIIILLILMIVSCVTIRRKDTKIIIFIVLLLALIFVFANYFRKGSDVIIKYYVNTGLYSGNIKTFFYTEIFRYIGMSQRLIPYYVGSFEPGYTNGIFTLYSFAKWVIPIELPENIMIHGYNALNIIGYLWRDFGSMWPVALFVLSSTNMFFYRLYTLNRNNSFCRLLWGVAFISTILSFYCYIHHYVYWVTLFPLFAIIANKLGKIKYYIIELR